MARRTYRGASVATTLAGSLTAGVTTATVASGGGTSLPDAIAGPFVITVNVGGATEEKILVGARTGDNLSTLTRGYDGTVAAAHAAGESVRHTISAVDLDEANGHINDTTLDQHTQYAKRGQGIAANVGAASRAGRLYIATDSEDLYTDDGTTVHRLLSKPSADAAYVATVGGSTITASGASVKPLTVKLAASQSANAFEVQPNGSTTPVLYVDSAGAIYPASVQTVGVNPNALGGTVTLGTILTVNTGGAGNKGVVLKGFALQTGNLLEAQASGSTTALLAVTSAGDLLLNTTRITINSSANNVATTATAGSAGALPSAAQGYVIVTIDGNPKKIPFYQP